MQGRVFLGEKTQPAPKYVFGGRDRMDETYDRIRTVRGERYRYVRNFHPELPYAQYINYMDEMPIMKDWRRLAFEGKLNQTQMLFMARTKPKEELYDLDTRPLRDQQPRAGVGGASGDPEGDARGARQVDRRHEGPGRGAGEGTHQARHRAGRASTEYDARVKLHPKTPAGAVTDRASVEA